MVKGGPMIIDYTLRHGSHESPQHGLCAMEWVAYMAGEKHSDYPSCVDLALRGFAIGLNDNLPDDLRQQLRPYLAGSSGRPTTDEARSADTRWLIGRFMSRLHRRKSEWAGATWPRSCGQFPR
jgi:hypothetical protein